MIVKVLTALAIAVPAIAPAQADPVTVVTDQVGVAAGGFVQATVVCPVGKVAVAGGAQVAGAGAGSFNTVIRESGPGTTGGGAQSLWLVAVSNNDPVARTIAIFAVCVNPPAGYQVVRKDVAVAAGGSVVGTAPCPVGKVVFGGGGLVIGAGAGNFTTVVRESSPGTIDPGAQSLWYLAMRNNGAQARTIGIFAVCANPPAGYETVRRDVVVAAGDSVATTALCPAGKVTLGGGGQVAGAGAGNFATVVRETAPGTVSGGALSLWYFAIRNNGAVDRTIGVFAVCAHAPAGYQIARRDVVLA